MATADTEGQAVPGSFGFALVCMIAGALVVLGIVAMVFDGREAAVTVPVPTASDGDAPPFVDLNADRGSVLPRSPPGTIIDLSPRAPLFEAD